MIEWSAKNNSSFLNGSRKAKTVRSAVRDARAYLMGELNGEGTITYYENEVAFREDEKSIFTRFRWSKRNLITGMRIK